MTEVAGDIAVANIITENLAIHSSPDAGPRNLDDINDKGATSEIITN